MEIVREAGGKRGEKARYENISETLEDFHVVI